MEKEFVYFKSGSSAIEASQHKVLDNFAEILLKNPSFKVVAHGYTDDVGDVQTNKVLSKLRADGVKRYLIKKGVPAERIQIEYTAKSSYVADNKTEEGRRQNRRVEMIVVAPK
jgi:outer membrane protein OmpA-like peptidoglycan-associated protein